MSILKDTNFGKGGMVFNQSSLSKISNANLLASSGVKTARDHRAAAEQLKIGEDRWRAVEKLSHVSALISGVGGEPIDAFISEAISFGAGEIADKIKEQRENEERAAQRKEADENAEKQRRINENSSRGKGGVGRDIGLHNEARHGVAGHGDIGRASTIA